MSESKKEEAPFEFLDEKCEDMTLYKVLRPNKDKDDIYYNTQYSTVFEYETYTWYTEEKSTLDRSMRGNGFYSFMNLESIIRTHRFNVKEILKGILTIHQVEVKDVCAIGETQIRSRKVRIEDAMSIDEIIEELTHWGETPEKILEKYTEYTKELKRFSSVKKILDAKKELKEKEKVMKSNEPIVGEYWEIYNKFKPFFENLNITERIFHTLRIPHDLTNTNYVNFDNFNEDTDFTNALSNLKVALAFLKQSVVSQPRSAKLFITRMVKRMEAITEDASNEIDLVEGILERFEPLLSQIPKFNQSEVKDSYIVGDLLKTKRKHYSFNITRIGIGFENKEFIQEHE